MSGDIQRRDAENAEGRGVAQREDRPDLELEALVMQDWVGPGCDPSDGRPSAGWLVREDVVRGAVEMITGLQKRFDELETESKITEKAVRGAASFIAALEERNKSQMRVILAAGQETADLHEQVEALTAQLVEEERMVARLREVVLGAPRSLMLVPGTYEQVTVALVRLSPDGTELAATTDDTNNTEGADA